MKWKKNKLITRILVIIMPFVLVMVIIGTYNRCKISVYNTKHINKVTKIDYISIFGFNMFFLRKNHTEYKNNKIIGQFFYDNGGNNIKSKSEYTYDKKGNLIYINQYNYYDYLSKFIKSEKTLYIYDSLSLLIFQGLYQKGMNRDTSLTKISQSDYFYNKNHQLIKKKYLLNNSNNGSVDTIIYNSKGLQIREIHLKKTHPYKEKDGIWEYDSRDSLIYHHNTLLNDSIIYERNQKGFLVTEKHYESVDLPQEQRFYYYDNKDRLTMLKYISPNDYYTISYYYDNQNKVYKKQESKTIFKIPFILDLCTCYFYE